MQIKSSVRFYPFLFLALSIIVIFLSIKSASLPGVVNANAPDTVFSAQRARTYLKQIARAPHSLGTAEHERVRDYIVTTCRQLGLTVRIQNTVITRRKASTLEAANVYNIIATKKGVMPGKAIVNIAHYDSQPNTPGAADDGIGVAGMLETARAVQILRPMKNDIVFLFTDGEEEGQFGARAFVKDDPLAKHIGVAINWDFRGNSGVTITYETSEQNGWVMRQYAKGTKYPLANSMGYEISKRMPNDVDFSVIKRAGISGYTSGLLGGYSYYHSMSDNVNNIELRSMQQVGDNMLGVIKKIGNLSLEKTTAPNLSYFNLYGYWFIYYPASFNIFFIILVTVLFIAIVIKGFRDKKIKLAGFITGALALPATLTLSFFISSFLLKRIVEHYPMYSHFYDNNSYNSSWYSLAMMMMGLFLFSLVYQPIVKKWDHSSPFAGILFLGCVFMWLAYRFTPSASWLFSFPLLFLLAGFGWIIWKKENIIRPGFYDYLVNFISVIPTIFLFAPITYFVFLSFGLGNKMPAVTALVVIIAALSFPVLSSVFKTSRRLFPLMCIFGFLIMLLFAHFNSAYDKQHPLQTNIAYRLNTTKSTAIWVSKFLKTDKYSNKFFPQKKIDKSVKNSRIVNVAPVFLFASPIAELEKDTLVNNNRELTLHCYSPRAGVNMIGIGIDDRTSKSIINIQIIDLQDSTFNESDVSSIKNILYYGVGKKGFEVKFTMKGNLKLALQLYDQSLGIPKINNLTELPSDIIPSPGFRSFSTRIIKHFIL